ncbi:hypothetical protein MKP07_33745 [Niabella hibiscisoli]|nr:hypothetical protein [Niabella hibiscisoli]
MAYVLIIIGILLATLIISKIRLHLKFGKEVKMLFASSGNISPKLYSEGLLAGLPEPVQQYFRYALTDGQSYINYARIKHNGQFRTGFDKNWTNIQGEQYATTPVPSFIWKGSTSFFVARDMYISGKADLLFRYFQFLR